jgi:hypothetical protein
MSLNSNISPDLRELVEKIDVIPKKKFRSIISSERFDEK